MLLTVLWFVISLFVILLSGMYIWSGLAFLGIINFEYFMPRVTGMIGNAAFNSISNFNLSAIPLFMFMGEIVLNTNISKSLYDGLSKMLAPLPGGILNSNIAACTFFGAISGSSVATASAIGSVAFPEQKKRNYPVQLISGSLAAGGTLGILIPPSIPLIIYGSMTGISIGKLFIAGIIPGIFLSSLFIIYIIIYSITQKDKMPERKKINFKEYILDFLKAWKDIWPIALIMITILVGIYGGFLTATEAAAITVVESLIIAFLLKSLNLDIVRKSAEKALVTTTMILVIVLGSSIFGNIISMLKLPANLCNLVAELGVSPPMVLFYVTCLYLFLGCVMSATAMIILTLPITYPLIVGVAGFNPIWFGIFIVLLNEVALLTPPVGMNVFVIYGISKEKDIGIIFKSVIPFLLILVTFIIIIIFFPQIVLFLPNI